MVDLQKSFRARLFDTQYGISLPPAEITGQWCSSQFLDKRVDGRQSKNGVRQTRKHSASSHRTVRSGDELSWRQWTPTGASLWNEEEEEDTLKDLHVCMWKLEDLLIPNKRYQTNNQYLYHVCMWTLNVLQRSAYKNDDLHDITDLNNWNITLQHDCRNQHFRPQCWSHFHYKSKNDQTITTLTLYLTYR